MSKLKYRGVNYSHKVTQLHVVWAGLKAKQTGSMSPALIYYTRQLPKGSSCLLETLSTKINIFKTKY